MRIAVACAVLSLSIGSAWAQEAAYDDAQYTYEQNQAAAQDGQDALDAQDAQDAAAANFAAYDEPAATVADPSAPPPVEDVAVQPTPPTPEETPTLDRFQQALSPYGRWVNTPEYGLVWVPSGVPATWRPYTNGRWVYTDAGWSFVSSDSWGWAPFHYGRWTYYGSYGWSWIPGYEWSPAWVSWRYGGGYIAWAPLGPVGAAVSYYNTPSLWSAVSGPYFYRPLAYNYFIPTARIGGIFRSTYFVGIPRAGRYYSPPAAYVSRLVGQPIARVSIRHVAPYWAAGTYRPSAMLQNAFRSAPIVARPTSWRGNAYAPIRTAPRVTVRPGFSVNTRVVSPRTPALRPNVNVNVNVRPAIQPRPYVQPSRPTTVAPSRPYVQPSRTYVQPSRPTTVAPSRPYVQPSRSYVQPSRSSIQPSRPLVQPNRSPVAPSYSQPYRRPYVQPSRTYVQPSRPAAPTMSRPTYGTPVRAPVRSTPSASQYRAYPSRPSVVTPSTHAAPAASGYRRTRG